MTSAERNLTPAAVLRALSLHIGRDKGVSVGNLVYEATGRAPHPAAERRAREVISELRMAGHHICGHPRTGYFMAETADDLDGTCAFLYERAMTGLRQVAAMKRVSVPDLRGQLKLPT
jgi:hypothetical protein